MGQADLQPRRYTVEEYLALEEASDVRHDFYEGGRTKRPGNTATHNTLVGNCMRAFRPPLRGSSYRAYVLDTLLVLREGLHYTYPYLLICPATDGPSEPALMRQPHLLLDVLDPETADFDRARKYPQYRQLPSLRHHLLVWQTTQLIEWYQPTEHGEWSHTALAEAEAVMVIPELGLTMTLAQVYEETGVAPMRVVPPAGSETA